MVLDYCKDLIKSLWCIGESYESHSELDKREVVLDRL